MEELIARVTGALGIDAGVAQKAIGLVLSFLQKQAPEAEFAKLLEALPGAQDAMDVAPGQTGGGLMGALGGLMGGAGAGGLMGLASQLQGLGLGMTDIQGLGEQFFTYAKEHAGEETVQQVASSIPGLDRFI
ncbi:MAG: DUF2267 domain-containing protein [Beijerinckiaceae bacterium]|nr:DUF2267 domain-containing protein [Beijerinckiaceae bacterium]